MSFEKSLASFFRLEQRTRSSSVGTTLAGDATMSLDTRFIGFLRIDPENEAPEIADAPGEDDAAMNSCLDRLRRLGLGGLAPGHLVPLPRTLARVPGGCRVLTLKKRSFPSELD